MCGQVYGSEYFPLNLAREAVAHIAGSISQESAFGCKISIPSSSHSPSSLPLSKKHGSRTSSATSTTELHKRERRLKALKTYGKLGLNRK